MNTPRKWADVIKAWADGKEIQYRLLMSESREEWGPWETFSAHHPDFSSLYVEWRIKPQVQTGWIALYGHPPKDGGISSYTSHVHRSLEDLKKNLSRDSIHSIIQISWTEGEGL